MSNLSRYFPLSIVPDEFGTPSVLRAATGENVAQMLGMRAQLENRAKFFVHACDAYFLNLPDIERAEILQAALERCHATLNLIASVGFGKLLDTPENRAGARAALDDASEALQKAGAPRIPAPNGTPAGTVPVR